MKRALLLVGSLILPFLLLEALLRLSGAGGPAEHPSVFDRRTLYYRSHPTRLHPHTPVQDEFLKVALIGDSFTFGSASDWDDAFGRRLERLLNLNEDTPPAEVRIWAQKGSATVQQIKFLHKAVQYRPDLLILAIFLNDPEDPGDRWLGISRKLRRPRTPSGWKLNAFATPDRIRWGLEVT